MDMLSANQPMDEGSLHKESLSIIRILPEVLSNKIAAGEVVERPASVVKELVENSLDAKSDRIIVEIKKGGRSLISVSDNGIGMNRDDALLSIERYATSKIGSVSDLFAIRSFGFRGEALPSIASVSRLVMETRDKPSETGLRMEIVGGKIKNVLETGAPVGTRIDVKDLFFNTPARKKFMKTINTETAHILDTVSDIALGHPETAFRVIHNGKTIKRWSRTDDPSYRIAEVMGKEFRNNLRAFEAEEGDCRVRGWIAPPGIHRGTTRGIRLFVNQRPVRDPMIRHALIEGYRQRLVKGSFPVAVLFIEVPPDRVDVNVHPTKREVRFQDAGMIHSMVSRTVHLTLARAEHAKTVFFSEPETTSPSEPFMGTNGSESSSLTGIEPKIAESALPFDVPEKKDGTETPPGSKKEPVIEITPEPPSIPEKVKPPAPIQETLWKKGDFSEMRVIGQFRNTYIVCESDGSLILIDQHAAHERILYEKIKKTGTGSEQFQTQGLLVPEVVEVGAGEAAVLDEILPRLKRTGLEVEPFGEMAYVVKSVPAVMTGRELGPLIREIAEVAAGIGTVSGIDGILDETYKRMACHGAIRAHQALSDAQIKGILLGLDTAENPDHCPHGRPTWIKWTQRFIEKTFQRIV